MIFCIHKFLSVFSSFSNLARSQSAELCNVVNSACAWSRGNDNWPTDDLNSGLHNEQHGEMHTNILPLSVSVGAYVRTTLRCRIPLVQTVSVSNVRPNDSNHGARRCVRVDIHFSKI